jgi:zinc transport system substrate-binding protein
MRLPLLAALALIPAAALAEVPQVVTDTAPIQSLVARVMGDLGQPLALIPPGTSPHDAALRPSDAGALAEADVVIWTGEALVPMLAGPIDTLAPTAMKVALLSTDGWSALDLRDDADFADHDHDHGDAGHDSMAIDPHGWLDPAVAAIWVGTIAETLAAVDAGNAAVYRANAAAAAADFVALRDRLAVELAPLAGRAYLVPHDGYQYFENAFALPAAGAVTLADAATPGPAHVADLRGQIAEGGIVCLLTDPQTPPAVIALVSEGTALRTAAADPDGQTLPPGPDLYPAIIEGIAAALQDCLGG